MQKRRILLVVTFLFAAFGGVLAPYYIFWKRPTFTQAQCERLKHRMTKDEVIAILGAPPGDYTNGQGKYLLIDDDLYYHWSALEEEKWFTRWCGENGGVMVRFDENGRLETKSFSNRHPPQPTVWDRIKRWLSFRNQ